jgi:2-oxoglutarate ferredoxin oxidoreductase subunit alpha
VRIERGEFYAPNGEGGDAYRRFALTDSGISPRAVLGQSGGTHWLTGAEHTVEGFVTEDPTIREQMLEKRARKLDLAAREIPAEEKLRIAGDPNIALTIVSWGSTKGAVLEALERLQAAGIPARLVQVRLLWPFPADELRPWLETADPLVVAEANYSGQLAQLLQEQTGHRPDHLIVKYNGRPMSGQALYQAMKSVSEKKTEARIVLRNPNE